MSLLANNLIRRHCSRCGKDLDDVASREAGIGPVCARRNTALFARTLPVNLTKAMPIFLCLNKEDFNSDIQVSFVEMSEKLVTKLCSLAGANEVTGKDFREFVGWFDLALSYQMANSVRTKVINVVEALGYPALAAVFRGEASMSDAKLSYENDRVYMAGKANKAGYFAMRRTFGRELTGPRYRGDKTPYSVPAHLGKQFIEVAVRYWPFIEIENSDLVKKSVDIFLEQVRLSNEIIDEVIREERKPNQVALHFNNSNGGWTPFASGTFFSVEMPWVQNKTQEACGLYKSEIEKNNRYYNPAVKTWFFKNSCHAKVVEILGKTGFNLAD